jgi:uncharacterized protein YjbI with pentapeptide repeats
LLDLSSLQEATNYQALSSDASGIGIPEAFWHRDFLIPPHQEKMEINSPQNQEKPKAPDWLLENITEASKIASKIYLIYVGFLAYSALTVVSTTDRQIILNSTARLPLVNVEVSLNGFFIVAPLIAIFVFFYFQLYLHRIKGLINDLRVNYAPTEKRRLYPWLINIAEDPEPGIIGMLQKVIVRFSVWWSLPIVLTFFAFGFIRKHDPTFCYIVGALPILGTLIVLLFWFYYEPVRKNSFTKNIVGKVILAFSVVLLDLSLLFFIIPPALEGNKYEFDDVRYFLNNLLFVDLSYKILVTEQKEEYQNIYWLGLKKAHLEGAYLVSTILKRADLSEAKLQKAYMPLSNLEKANLMDANLQEADLNFATLQRANIAYANLQEAYLRGANLQEANLWGANLQGAWLWGANLQSATLRDANLQGTWLVLANLQKAYLQGANLQEAHLWGGNLQGAKLRGAQNLTIEQLSTVKTLYKAELDSTLLEQIKKDYPHLLEEPKAGK